MTARQLDHAIAELAAVQGGVFSRVQAIELGATTRMIDRRLAASRWTAEGHGVYGLPGASPSFRRRLWLSYLSTGPSAVVSHEAAAALHGFSGFPPRGVVLTVPHSRWCRIPDAFVHQISDVAECHRQVIEGLPVTTVARTFVDLAAVSRMGRLAVALDDALAARQVTVPEVGRCLAAVARRGKPGVRPLAVLLDERGPGYVPPASQLEGRLLRALRQGGLPAPVRQFRFPGRQSVDGCVDMAYPDVRVILEADGRRWHVRTQDMARDRARDNEAARAGWQTLRFMYEDVRSHPDEVAATVAETRSRRRAPSFSTPSTTDSVVRCVENGRLRQGVGYSTVRPRR